MQVHTEPCTGDPDVLQGEVLVTQALLLRGNSHHQHSLTALMPFRGARQKGHLGVARQYASLEKNLITAAEGRQGCLGWGGLEGM